MLQISAFKEFWSRLAWKKSERTDKNQPNKQKKILTETCPDLIKENVQSILKDIVVYISENALMEYTGEAEIHEKKIVLH